MMEALLGSFSRSKILSCVSGSFGERFYQVAEVLGHDITRIDSVEGQGFTPEQVLDSLDGHDIILLTHNETSNGILNPVEEIATAIEDSLEDPLVFVDGVSSVGGVPLDCRGIDAILFGTQKCLALPPGLAFCSVSSRMQEFLKDCNPKSFLHLFRMLLLHTKRFSPDRWFMADIFDIIM